MPRAKHNYNAYFRAPSSHFKPSEISEPAYEAMLPKQSPSIQNYAKEKLLESI